MCRVQEIVFKTYIFPQLFGFSTDFILHMGDKTESYVFSPRNMREVEPQ